MTTSSSTPRRSRPRSILPPFVQHVRRQEARRKDIVRGLLRSAADWESKAAMARKLAARSVNVDALRNRDLLIDLVQFGVGRSAIAALFGVEDLYLKIDPDEWVDDRRMFMLNCIMGQSDLRVSSPRGQEQLAPVERVEPAKTGPAPPPKPRNALAEAERIARELAGHDDLNFDWTAEPGSDRERKIRAALLRAETDKATHGLGPVSAWWGVLRLTNLWPHKRCPSDVRAAFNLVDAIEREQTRAEQRKIIEDAFREVDGDS